MDHNLVTAARDTQSAKNRHAKKVPQGQGARCSLHLLSKMSITKLLHLLICEKHTVHYLFFLILYCCALHIRPINNVSPAKRGRTLQRATEDGTGGVWMDPQRGVLVAHHNSWDGMSLLPKQNVPKDWLCSIMQETGHVQCSTCIHILLSNICMFTGSCTTNHLTLFPSQLLVCFFFCTCTVFARHLHSCIVCIFLFM